MVTVILTTLNHMKSNYLLIIKINRIFGFLVYSTQNNDFQVLAGSASFLFPAYSVGESYSIQTSLSKQLLIQSFTLKTGTMV